MLGNNIVDTEKLVAFVKEVIPAEKYEINKIPVKYGDESTDIEIYKDQPEK